MIPTKDVHIERTFDAPIDLIWTMGTQAEHCSHWDGPNGAQIPSAEMDVRVGGRRRITMEMHTPAGPMRMHFVEGHGPGNRHRHDASPRPRTAPLTTGAPQDPDQWPREPPRASTRLPSRARSPPRPPVTRLASALSDADNGHPLRQNPSEEDLGA